ncbi:hypothetical protein EWM64_g2573 [Hericium alpestre]|uniref:HCP-like protein n=1 Tax=Hericium alpestre TaxID=135208 RepID=A0A4Z0A5B6_9AGAM|nr:hypothetical protein EWM64_g2573 [Hericium alpestre]
MWFERGAEYGDKECHNGLGIIWRDGLVNGRRDQKRAVHHFGVAAGQDLAEAQVNLGKYHYARKELKLATTYFETATRHGSPFEAYYYLAQIQSAQMNMMPPHMKTGACSIALSFYKIVAERGSWDDDLLRDGELDWESGTAAGKENAMLRWWIAAKRGYEMAQNNLAYVLDQGMSLALLQWTRSAAQNNVDALVKVGDYYYHGLGVPDEPESARWEKAAGYYQSAADTQVSALAMWNLGWMYENGYGVPQDFHLAKRHYDVALDTNNEAYLPVTLSLIKLHVRSLWHTLMGGKDGLSLWEYDEDAHAYVNEDKRQQLEDGSKLDAANQIRSDDEDILGEAVEDDAPWYLGRAREEFNRVDGDRGPWARERRNAENERDSDFGPEDYFEGALRGGHRGEEEADEFTETMVLVGLCLVVTFLLYIRGRMVERMRRDQGRQQQPNGGAEQQQQQQDGGLFPPPGDPARDDWAIAR